jgi:hypothetical protein
VYEKTDMPPLSVKKAALEKEKSYNKMFRTKKPALSQWLGQNFLIAMRGAWLYQQYSALFWW